MNEEVRIAVTGIGAVHALGTGVKPLVDALRAGDYPDVELLEADYDPEEYRESSKTYMDPCSDLALSACFLAVREAGLVAADAESPDFESERPGASLGTAWGTLETMLNMTGRVQERGLRFGSPMIFTHAFINTPAALMAIEYELYGPNMIHSMGDASSVAALDYAMTMIRAGRTEIMLAGGAEALSEPLLAAIQAQGFDGVPAEGAAILVLETAEHAAARGAAPIAELGGAACLAPCEDSAGERALIAAGVECAQVIDAATVCGHTFGASVALSAACCAALAAEADEPLAAVSADGAGAVVIEEWRE